MKYVKLGRTGLDVSRVVLGCMTYGELERGKHPWSLAEDARRDAVVFATKVHAMRPGPNGSGLSRKTTRWQHQHWI